MAKKRSLYRRMVEALTGSKPGVWITLNIASRFDPFFLRATRGRFSASNLFGYSALMLTTIGAKTGLHRSVALAFFHDGNRIVIVASRGGIDRHPGWYHNLKVHLEAAVLLDSYSGSYTAYEATGEERERLWALACDHYAGYAAYQKRAMDRRLPVMVLTPQPEQLAC
jgi:deazaflavin-dependent oxidoreductase (nitroreductase family)